MPPAPRVQVRNKFMNMLANCLGPLLVSFAVTLVATPVARRIAVATELYDRPDGGLKPHQRPIPYLGGAAMFAGWLAAIVWSARAGQVAPAANWVVVGGAVLMLIGLIDDIRHLPPVLRLLMQATSAGILLVGGVGDGVAAVLASPVAGGEVASGPAWLSASAVFCAVVLAGATNSTNLIDGLDGLCAGVLGIAACGFLVVQMILARSHEALPADAVLLAIIAATVMGACLAFLCVNFNPASMFMGDSGSLLLGFSAAAAIILLAEFASWRGLLAALTVFGFPIFDSALAVTRRWLHGRPLFIGDRSHFYDQVRDRGFSVRATVLVCYALQTAFLLMGCLIAAMPGESYWAVFAVLPFAGVLSCRRMGLLRVDDAAARSRPAG